MDKLYEMINQEFKAQGRNRQVLPNFRICCRELEGSKLKIFTHARAVSALSFWLLFASWIVNLHKRTRGFL